MIASRSLRIALYATACVSTLPTALHAQTQAASTPVERLATIASAASTGPYRWLARERQSAPATGDSWTVTAGSTHELAFVCIEHVARATRCWDVEAPSPSVIMPTADQDAAIAIRLGFEPSPGSLVHLVFEFENAAGDPRFAIVDALGTGRPLPPPPRVTLRPSAPEALPLLDSIELVPTEHGIVFAVHAGYVSACRVSSEHAWSCGSPVRAALPAAHLELEADEQSDSFVSLELVATTPTAVGFEQRESVVLFDTNTLQHAGTLPMGGIVLARPASGSTDEDRTLVEYELWREMSPRCVRIEPPELEHSAIVRGRERSLRAPRVARSGDWIAATAFDTQPLLVDVSGSWRIATDGLHRVPTCDSLPE